MEHLSLQDNVDQERRTKIAFALQQYRETVSQQNIALIRAVARAVEAQSVPDNWSESQAQKMRMMECGRLLRIHFPDSVSPQQLLEDDDVIADLVRSKHLDGISAHPLNLEQREECFAKIRARVREVVGVAEFPPADLRYLCTLVSGITGPGMSFHHDAQQFDFITPIEHAQMLEEMVNVVVPIRADKSGGHPQPGDLGVTYNELTYIWEEWEIAVASKIGGGPRWGGSYALYCRCGDASDDPFKWRYGVHDEEWESEVYDSVEEFLSFYAHFKEQSEQQILRSVRPVTKTRSG